MRTNLGQKLTLLLERRQGRAQVGKIKTKKKRDDGTPPPHRDFKERSVVLA